MQSYLFLRQILIYNYKSDVKIIYPFIIYRKRLHNYDNRSKAY